MPFDLDNSDADFRASEPWSQDIEYGADMPYPGKGLTPRKRVTSQPNEAPNPEGEPLINNEPTKGQ